MYTVGFVDNSFQLLTTYRERLGWHNINLLWPDAGLTKDEIVEWVLDNNIRCLLIDHKLIPDFDFIGTELYAYIKRKLPDLSCYILTSFQGDSVSENLVEQKMILEREELDRSDWSDFIATLKQAVQVCNTRMESRKLEYMVLLEQRRTDELDTEGIEQLSEHYKVLRTYRDVDELPAELLRPEIGQKMDSMLERMDVLIEKISTRKGDD